MDFTHYRKYRLEKKYVEDLLKIEGIEKVDVAKSLGITVNCLNLKLSGVSKLYIQEGILIATLLKMDIYDIFCPSDEQVLNILYNENILKFINEFKTRTKKTYREFNLNGDYIKKLMFYEDITYNNLCSLWNRKIVTVYEKLRGDTKISLEEGLKMSQLFGKSVNKLFCPSPEMVREVLKYNIDPLSKDAKNDMLILQSKNEFFEGFDIHNIIVNKDHLQYLLIKDGKSIENLTETWELSKQQVYNKLGKRSRISMPEIIGFCELVNEFPRDAFNPTEEMINNSKEFVVEYKKTNR